MRRSGVFPHCSRGPAARLKLLLRSACDDSSCKRVPCRERDGTHFVARGGRSSCFLGVTENMADRSTMLRALNFKCLSKKSGLRQLVTRSRGCREGRPDMTATYSNEGLLFESFITHSGAIHIFRTCGFPPIMRCRSRFPRCSSSCGCRF